MPENPLLEAIPPKTDYLTYLTIVEYNLSAEQLPVFHHILQDNSLTANIGWDLVHLLLPFWPASRQCLQDVARLGNPKEVILKVTELLEDLSKIDREEQEDGELEENGRALDDSEDPKARETMVVAEKNEVPGSETQPPPTTVAPPEQHFVALVEMLIVLHPRIKTNYPSRFLATSLQAILPGFVEFAADQAAVEVVFDFIKTLFRSNKPRLPPREDSNAVDQAETIQIAPDPQGDGDLPVPEEMALQNRLLQSFFTYVVDDIMLSMPRNSDTVGMGWSSRFQEKSQPEKIIPGKPTVSNRFVHDEDLRKRDDVLGRIIVSLVHGLSKS